MYEVTTCAEVIFRFKESCVSSVDGMNQGRSVRLVYAAGKKSCCAEHRPIRLGGVCSGQLILLLLKRKQPLLRH